MVSVKERIHQNLEDVRHFGPSVLRRHLGRLRDDRAVAIKLPGAGRIHVRAGQSDIATVRQIFVEREYALAWPPHLADRVQRHYRALLDAGRTPLIIDAGANIGAASAWFSNHFPEAQIAAIEPEPGNAQVLRRNIADRPKVRMFEAAIGGESGYVAVQDAGLSWGAQTERAAKGLPIVTIDDICREMGNDDLFIVKIDIEGFERDLFAANTGWVDRAFAVFIEPHDWMIPDKFTSRTFQQVMGRGDFEIYLRGENLLYLRAEEGEARDG